MKYAYLPTLEPENKLCNKVSTYFIYLQRHIAFPGDTTPPVEVPRGCFLQGLKQWNLTFLLSQIVYVMCSHFQINYFYLF